MTPLWSAVALAFGTLISEDLATISAGLLAASGNIDPVLAVVAVSLGTYVGDLGVFTLGRLARKVPFVRRRILSRWNAEVLASLAARFDRHTVRVVFGSRFLPGSRLPLHLSAGLFCARTLPYVGWSFVAVLVWTPLLMGRAMWLGASVASYSTRYVTWAPTVGLAVAAYVLTRWWGRAVRHVPV